MTLRAAQGKQCEGGAFVSLAMVLVLGVPGVHVAQACGCGACERSCLGLCDVRGCRKAAVHHAGCQHDSTPAIL